MNPELTINAANDGDLKGMTFAVKDVFHIEGHTSSAGNPDWLKTHEPAKATASSLQKLVNNGAALKGTTITDEIMYSLNGENFHYGTPVNPADENRIPGGSSSGSAVCVAAGLADFAIGTDTGGSVRIPSSYCGIFGIRPTHGLVAIDGVIPLAKSFDTVGWMAKSADTLLKVGKVLIDKAPESAAFTEFIFAEDAWGLADEKAVSLLKDLLEKKAAVTSSTVLAEKGLEEWKEVFRILQGNEIWQEHGEWIKKENPAFGPGIKERFEMASRITEEEVGAAAEKREEIIGEMQELLKENTILIIPTAPDVSPLLNLPTADLEKKRSQTLQLCCIAGLSGLPQVNVPLANIDGAPIGVSFIAGKNQDIRLLQWIADTFPAI